MIIDHSLGLQFSRNPGTAIKTATVMINTFDLFKERFVFKLSCTFRSSLPGVIGAPGYFKRLAHLCHPELGAVKIDILELHSGCFAKKATAFFKMSRSSLMSANSRLSRRISSSLGFK